MAKKKLGYLTVILAIIGLLVIIKIFSSVFKTKTVKPTEPIKTERTTKIKEESGIIELRTSLRDGIDIRTGPGTNYKKNKQLVKGEELYVLEEKNGWIRFRTTPEDDGAFGWVKKDWTVAKEDTVTTTTGTIDTKVPRVITDDTGEVPEVSPDTEVPEDIPDSMVLEVIPVNTIVVERSINSMKVYTNNTVDLNGTADCHFGAYSFKFTYDGTILSVDETQVTGGSAIGFGGTSCNPPVDIGGGLMQMQCASFCTVRMNRCPVGSNIHFLTIPFVGLNLGTSLVEIPYDVTDVWDWRDSAMNPCTDPPPDILMMERGTATVDVVPVPFPQITSVCDITEAKCNPAHIPTGPGQRIVIKGNNFDCGGGVSITYTIGGWIAGAITSCTDTKIQAELNIFVAGTSDVTVTNDTFSTSDTCVGCAISP